MGCYSFLYCTSGKPDLCTIDWSRLDTDLLVGFSRLQWICEQECKKDIANRIPNLAELAEQLDESKLFGYFTNDMKMALMELSQVLVPYEVDGKPGRPKLYFDVEGEEDIAMLEFVPGTSSVYVARIQNDWIEEVHDNLEEEGLVCELENILEGLEKKIVREYL